MLHLDLPAVELLLDDDGKVVDAAPEDDSYTHTVIEMCMVEANEAVARLLTKENRPFLRRIHADPDQGGSGELTGFLRALGKDLPKDMSRHDLQRLLASVKGKPESYAVNLAVLKTFQQAEYSPMKIGHYALASDNYCHFTSPIRRYPDLTVHRLLRDYCRGRLDQRPPEDGTELNRLAEACTAAERKASAAEDELREVLILQFLETKKGEIFDGVITGVTSFGLFVQWPKYLCEGLIRLADLGRETWDVKPKSGTLRAKSGTTYRLGDLLKVQIVDVDPARRQLTLMPVKTKDKGKDKDKGKSKPQDDSKPKKQKPRKRRR